MSKKENNMTTPRKPKKKTTAPLAAVPQPTALVGAEQPLSEPLPGMDDYTVGEHPATHPQMEGQQPQQPEVVQPQPAPTTWTTTPYQSDSGPIVVISVHSVNGQAVYFMSAEETMGLGRSLLETGARAFALPTPPPQTETPMRED